MKNIAFWAAWVLLLVAYRLADYAKVEPADDDFLRPGGTD